MQVPSRIVIGPGGFLGWYLLGITSYLKNNYDISSKQVGGTSAGAIISLAALSPSPIQELLIHPSVEQLVTAPIGKKWKLYPSVVRDVFRDVDMDHDRLFVSLTEVSFRDPFFKPRILDSFSSKEEAVEYALASAHVPFLSGTAWVNLGEGKFCDGAISGKSESEGRGGENALLIHSGMFGRQFGFEDVMGGTNDALSLYLLGYEDAKHESGTFSSFTRLNPVSRIRNEVVHRKITSFVSSFL